MDIGAKLRQARGAAGLTQEQAAAALGVSRQTVSNWENNRTYPDIVSVVRISDLYAVSLDHLLKEGASVNENQTYLHYLEESTDAVGSRRRLSQLILAASYLAIWAAALLAFWRFAGPSDAMGYSLMFLWLLLPAAAFVLSLLGGRLGCWGRAQWLAPPLLGLGHMLAQYGTFGAAAMAASQRFVRPDPLWFAVGAAASLAGLLPGILLRRRRARRKAA